MASGGCTIIAVVLISLLQVNGCKDGFVERSVEKDGTVEVRCCRPVNCGPGTEVKLCTENKGPDYCQLCPSGTSQHSSSSSSNPKSCYLTDSPCGEDADGEGQDCKCKPGYCGDYPNCLKGPCPVIIRTPDPTPTPSTTTSTTTTAATPPTTVDVVTLPLPAENLNTGTTSTTFSPSINLTTSLTGGENGTALQIPVISVTIFLVVGAVLLIWWFKCRNHNGNTNQQHNPEVGYTGVPTAEERDHERINIPDLNGGESFTALSPVQTNHQHYDNGGPSANHPHDINRNEPDAPAPSTALESPTEPQQDQSSEVREPIEAQGLAIQEVGEAPSHQDPHSSLLGTENFVTL